MINMIKKFLYYINFNIFTQLFQELEYSHLQQMKDFITLYTELIEGNHVEIGKVCL